MLAIFVLITTKIMTSRIEENSIKAVIYFMLFMVLMLKSFFLQASSEQTETRQAPTGIPVPMPVNSDNAM